MGLQSTTSIEEQIYVILKSIIVKHTAHHFNILIFIYFLWCCFGFTVTYVLGAASCFEYSTVYELQNLISLAYFLTINLIIGPYIWLITRQIVSKVVTPHFHTIRIGAQFYVVFCFRHHDVWNGEYVICIDFHYNLSFLFIFGMNYIFLWKLISSVGWGKTKTSR